uniref:Uncharacterized protein n=1 Tax=Romanomermis culicivorax TaxID=13658 RepID=A0A915IID7_ROMCU
MWTSPLSNLSLGAPIDVPITQHFEQGWLNDFGDEFFKSRLHNIYHIHFLIGLLCSIKSSKVEKNVFYRRISDKNLRIFIVRKERIIFHNILYKGFNGATPNNVTDDEADALGEALKKLHFKLADTDNFEMFSYTAKKVPKNPRAKALMRMELVENLTWTFKVSKEQRSAPKKSIARAKHEINEDLLIKKDVSSSGEYIEVIGKFFKMRGIRNKEQMKNPKFCSLSTSVTLSGVEPCHVKRSG